MLETLASKIKQEKLDKEQEGRKEGRRKESVFCGPIRLFTEKIQNNLQKSGTRKTAQVSGFKNAIVCLCLQQSTRKCNGKKVPSHKGKKNYKLLEDKSNKDERDL